VSKGSCAPRGGRSRNFSRRGKIEVKVEYTHRTLPRVISIPHEWDQENPDVLTDDADPIMGFPSDRSLLVRIAKES
jgi:anaerobic selenocysteine-containing dehydrogenase